MQYDIEYHARLEKHFLFWHGFVDEAGTHVIALTWKRAISKLCKKFAKENTEKVNSP